MLCAFNTGDIVERLYNTTWPLSPLPPHKALCIRSSTFGNKVCDCSVLNCQTDIFLFIHKIEGGNSAGIHSEHPQFQRDLAVINPPNQMQHSDSDCGAGTVETNLTTADSGWKEDFLDFSGSGSFGFSWSVSSLSGSLTLLYLATKKQPCSLFTCKTQINAVFLPH